MGNGSSETFNPFDPAGVFKDVRDASLGSWAKMMVDVVNTDAYAEATGSMLDAWLTTSGPFRDAVEGILTQNITSLNLPTRDDVTRLAGRMTNIEMRLDDLDAKLDELLAAITKSSSNHDN